jgi:hypothetical protein
MNERLSLKEYFAFGGLVDPGDRIKDRSFARSVRANHGENLPGFDAQVHGIHCGDPAEPHGQVRDGQDSH